MTGKPWTPFSAIAEIDSLHFECEAGPLANSEAWRWLKQHLNYKPVTVTVEGEQGTISVLRTFATVKEAENFIATHWMIRPDWRDAGRYSIDAPEEMINGRA